MQYYLYIVRSKDNSLYTGITNNVVRRVHEHNKTSRGAKALRGKLPVNLVYSQVYKSKSQALKREHEIKNWNKDKKEDLVSAGVVSAKG